jgi:hypothetical protein
MQINNNLERRKHNVTSHVAQVRKHPHTRIPTVKDDKLCPFALKRILSGIAQN